MTGTYTILVDPQTTNTGSVTLTLYDVPPDVTGTLTPGGPPLTVTTTTPGQNAQPTINATTGQRVYLKVTGVALSGGANNWVNVLVKRPDGTTQVSDTFSSSGGFIDTQTLALDGAYTVLVDPWTTSTGSATLTLYDVPADITGTITPGGGASTVTTTAVGQNVRLTFDGTANQRVSLKITGVTLSGGSQSWANIYIKKPDGTNLTSTTVDTAGGYIDTKTLPVTGTYTILVDPLNTTTGSMTLTLCDVPADITGPITPGGSPVTVTTTTPGQNANLTFEGAANQRVSLNVSGVSMTGNTWVNVWIKKPDGTNLTSDTFGSSGGYIDAKTLPVAGTYTVLVDPYNSNTGSATVTLYDVPADAAASTTINADAVGVTTTVPGQNARVTFDATSGQQVTVRITNNTVGTVTVKLLRPDGTQQTTASSSASSFNLTTQTLTSTGTYTVSIDPSGSRTGSMSVRVTSP